ncbi:SixA phosphatase family protein [Sulfurimonas sp.]
MRHAKSDWGDGTLSDFERKLKKRGYKDLNTIGSYLSLKGVMPEYIISSAALRAQITTESLAKRISYDGEIEYMDELYLTKPETILNVLSLEDDSNNSIFLVGHNPTLTELANFFQSENITKFPTTGVLKLNLEINSWSEISHARGKIDFFISPKQFKYYIPREVRERL